MNLTRVSFFFNGTLGEQYLTIKFPAIRMCLPCNNKASFNKPLCIEPSFLVYSLKMEQAMCLGIIICEKTSTRNITWINRNNCSCCVNKNV